MPSLVLEQFTNGLTPGRVCALPALGFALIFGTLRVVAFAHGEGCMIRVYVGFEIIRMINHEEWVAVLLMGQNATMALSIAARGYVLQTGEIVLQDTAANLCHNPPMQQSILRRRLRERSQEAGNLSFSLESLNPRTLEPYGGWYE